MQIPLQLTFPDESPETCLAAINPLQELLELAIASGRIPENSDVSRLRESCLNCGLSRAAWRFLCKHGKASYEAVLDASENPETQMVCIIFYLEWQVRGALTEPLPIELGERLIIAVGHIFADEYEIDPRIARAALKHWKTLNSPLERNAFARRNWVKILNWFREENPQFDSNQWRSGWKVIDRKYRQWEMRKPGSTSWISKLDAFEHDRFHVQPLTNHFDLAQEGFRMRHCVATYASQCLSGKYRLFSISDKASGKAIATASIERCNDRWRADQVKGKYNRIPSATVCKLGPVIEAAYIREEERAAKQRAQKRQLEAGRLRAEHNAYLSKRGKVPEAIRCKFNLDELELLEKYLPFLQALLAGEIQPVNIEQVHFIAVAMGLGRANTDLERLWLRYKRCISSCLQLA